MNHRIIAATVLTLATSACDRGDVVSESQAQKPARQPQIRAHVNQPVEVALTRIAPGERASYQQAFACEVKRNNAKKGKAIAVTPEYVAALAERVRANPQIAKC